jgi:UDP-N-acetylmuramoylalanine--D-glutamate ligase
MGGESAGGPGRRVVVAGIAVSGVAVADALLDRGARVIVVDGRDGDAEREQAARLRSRGAEVRLGDAETPVDADLVVTSPGWRPTNPLLAAALAAGVEVIGEPELAWRLRPQRDGRATPWVAVTGTNGKTTTVGMVESILRAAGHRTIAAGNVGRPLIEAVLADPPYDVIAVELSSFQLHWSRELAPDAAVVLNVAEDHLDWHGSFDAYAQAKASIWRHGGCGAYNADDPVVTRLALASPMDCRHPFTMGSPARGEFGVVDDVIVDATSGWQPDLEPEPTGMADHGIELIAIRDLPVSGPHNVANAVAAAAVTRVLNIGGDVQVPWPAVGEGLRAYRPGRHRNALVAEHDSVAYVDDSKATNPHAADASLGAYDSVVWIAGGLLKGADVAPLVQAHRHRLRGVVVIGADRRSLLDAMARHAPDVPVVEVTAGDTDVMDEAVHAAAALARAGDTVLLAPAAASMDQFRDYADRGERFAAAVAALGEDRS